MRKLVLLILAFILLTNSIYAIPWWNNTWHDKYNNFVPNGTRPYQVSVNISNNTGFFQNATHLNVVCSQANCTDIRVVMENTTLLNYWRDIEKQNTSINGSGYSQIYFNLTTNGTFQIYSNASSLVPDLSNGTNTFPFFEDCNGTLGKWIIIQGTWIINSTVGECEITSTGTPDRMKSPVNITSFALRYDIRYATLLNTMVGEMIIGDRTASYQSLITGDPSQGIEIDKNGSVILKANTWIRNTGKTQIDLKRNQTGNLTQYLNGTIFNAVTDNTMIEFNAVMLESHGGTGSDHYFDNIIVRNYITPEVLPGIWINETNITAPTPTPTPTINVTIVPTPISNCGVHTIINNTNLAPTIEPSEPGTGERVNATTYYTNNSEIDLHVFAHANAVSDIAGTFVYINGTLVCPRSGRPLGGAEVAYRGCDLSIPRGAYYRVEFFNYHHYEWREYKKDLDISGCIYPENNDSLNSVIMSLAFVIGLLVAFIVCLICQKRRRDK